MSLMLLPVLAAFAALTQAQTGPVIGILTQPNSPELTGLAATGGEEPTYIAASYVKFLESAGARVVPVFCKDSEANISAQYSRMNGLLIPGGGQDLSDPSNPFLKTATQIYNMAIEDFDKNGEVFPIWGTCLGFETLSVITGGPKVLMSGFDSENLPLPLNFTSKAKSSQIFGHLTDEVFKALEQENVTMNNHMSGVEPAVFENSEKLTSFYHMLSTNVDRKGRAFVSSMEGKKYPVYGVQWHPEKNAYEWTPKEQIPHSEDAVDVTYSMARFFVQQARKSTHTYEPSLLEKEIIYNYSPNYTLPTGSSFEQCYYFTK